MAFPTNYDASVSPKFYITGNTDTTGTVTIPGQSIPVPFTVTAGKVTTVTIPTSAEIQPSSSNVIGNLGIHIVAADNVTVYGFNSIPYTTDAYLALPTAVLGEEYLVMAFPTTLQGYGSEFAIVGTAESTIVTITPTATVGTRIAGVAYTITLNQGQTYELQAPNSGNDVSGTLITSDAPVAVYGGSVCTDVPNSSTYACNHLVEQMPPTSAWGKAFYTEPLATRTKGDTFRFLVSVDGTTISLNGSTLTMLNRAKVYQMELTAASEITSDQPILVMQYSNGTTYDGASSDPFMMLVPPFEQYLTGYTITTPASGFSPNYVNVIAPTAGASSITLDGTSITSSLFKQIGSSSYSGAQVPLAIGAHNLAGSVPFGLVSYGFAPADGYGYIGGFSLSPVASVSSVTVGSSARHFWMQGGSVQVHGQFWHGLGVVGEVSGLHTGDMDGSGVALDMVTATFGPRYTWQIPRRRFCLLRPGAGRRGECLPQRLSPHRGSNRQCLLPGCENRRRTEREAFGPLLPAPLPGRMAPHTTTQWIHQRTE